MVIKVNSDNFETEVLKADKRVVLDLYADWCMPCKMMSPVVESMSEKHPEVKFCQLNVDDSRDVAMNYKVASIPTFLVFVEGELKSRLVGAMSAEDFETSIFQD